MAPHRRWSSWDEDDVDEAFDDPELDEPRHQRSRPARKPRPARQRAIVLEDGDELEDELAWVLEQKERDRRRVEISEPFKCRNCKAFIGEPPSGGRQRNHCPLCLYSLHVDDRTPGDRASDCRSLMTPVGTFYRRNLEQVLVHECRGCGVIRYNRIAADDNPVLLSRLPVIEPPASDIEE